MEKQISIKPQLWDLTLLSARYLLAAVFISYGVSKLFGLQFGNLTDTEMGTALRDLSLFQVAWYLFEDRLFSCFVGISQITAALLLLFRRTFIIGVAILIPILLNILVIDIMIMPKALKIGFIFRLTFYLVLCGLILHRERTKLYAVWNIVTKTNKFKPYRIWMYCSIPLLMVIIECTHVVIKWCYLFVKHYIS